LNIAEQFLAQRRQAQTPRGVGSGILLLQANGDGIQIGARLFQHEARFEPSDDAQGMEAADLHLRRCEIEWLPDFSFFRIARLIQRGDFFKEMRARVAMPTGADRRQQTQTP